MQAYWYYDFISPFAYLQIVELSQRQPPVELVPQPILLAGVLKHHGHLGPAEIPAKRRFTYQFVAWLAKHKNIPFRFPPAHPFNPLPLLRLAIACQAGWTATRRIFEYVWRDGLLPDDPAAFATLAAELNVSDVAQAIASPAVKQQLIQNTETALQRGIFGVPTLQLNDQLFWGQDSTAMLFDYLEQPDWFSSDDMQRLADLPAAVQRRTG